MSKDPLAPIEVVATNSMFCDPAIDAEPPTKPDGTPDGDADEYDAMLAKYRKERDLATLRLRSGMEPTRFVCKPLPAIYVSLSIDNLSNPALQAKMAFMASCHEIKLPNGAVMKPAMNKLKPGRDGVSVAPDDWFNDVSEEFGRDTIVEVGMVAFERARLPKKAKGPFSYLLG